MISTLNMQATVDAHTAARIWRFLKDGGFMDSKSHQLDVQMALHNSVSGVTVLWNLIIRLQPSGRIQADGVFMPITSSSLHHHSILATNIVACAVALMYALFVTGLVPRCCSRHPEWVRTVHVAPDCASNTLPATMRAAIPVISLDQSSRQSMQKHASSVPVAHTATGPGPVAESHATKRASSFGGSYVATFSPLDNSNRIHNLSDSSHVEQKMQVTTPSSRSDMQVGLADSEHSDVSTPRSRLQTSSSPGTSPIEFYSSNPLDGALPISMHSKKGMKEAASVIKMSFEKTQAIPVPSVLMQSIVGKRHQLQPEPLGESTTPRPQAANRNALDSPRSTSALGSHSGIHFMEANLQSMDGDVSIPEEPLDVATGYGVEQTGAVELGFKGHSAMTAWHAESFRSNASGIVSRPSRRGKRSTRRRSQHSHASQVHVGRSTPVDKHLDQTHVTYRGKDSEETLYRVAAQPSLHSRSFLAMHDEGGLQERRTTMQTINSLAMNRQPHVSHFSHTGSASEVPLNRMSTWGSNTLTDVGDEYILYKHHCVPVSSAKGGTGQAPAHSLLAADSRCGDVLIPDCGLWCNHFRPPDWLRGLTVVSVAGLTLTAAVALGFSMRAQHFVQQFDTSSLQRLDLHHLVNGAYHDLQSPARMLMPQKIVSSGSGRNLLHSDDEPFSIHSGA